MLIGGIIFLVLAAGLFYVKRTEEEKLGYIAAIQTSNTRDIVEAAGAVAERSGKKGGFRQLVEVKGVIKCQNPLTSEVAKQKCVYYDMSVTRKAEETYQEKNSQGAMVSKTRQKTETVASNKQSVPFYVEDATGKILVNPNGAEIDPMQVADKFESGVPVQTGTTVTLGGFTFNLTGAPIPQQGMRILGYNYKEEILPLDRKVYVLGEVSDAEGELTIITPKDKGRFIVSLKSEEELMKSGSSSIQFMGMGMIVCGLAGLGLIIGSFLR